MRHLFALFVAAVVLSTAPSLISAQQTSDPPMTLRKAPATPFLIFVDTAGVATVGPDTYITWIFAKSTPTSLPSSGILVVFDCGQRLVQRIAHVVYQLDPADSTKVIGPVVGDSGSAVPPTVPGVFELVCQVGREHGYDVPAPAEKPKAPKTSPYSQS